MWRFNGIMSGEIEWKIVSLNEGLKKENDIFFRGVEII
jgi:hypothetical protein